MIKTNHVFEIKIEQKENKDILDNLPVAIEILKSLKEHLNHRTYQGQGYTQKGQVHYSWKIGKENCLIKEE